MCFRPGIHLSDNCCRLRWSTQHWLAVYSQEFRSLRFFSGVDSDAARSGRVALANGQTGRFLAGSIAATADSCFLWCRVARDFADHRSTPAHSHLSLTLAEREDISRGIASDSPLREIARRLDRAASTLSREISRHGGRPAYRAHDADRRAWDSALRPKRCLLALHRKLRDIVVSKLILDWSPEQISGWLNNQYPDDESLRVSHETIYRSLFIQARGVLKKELLDHLRTKRRMRRARHASASG